MYSVQLEEELISELLIPVEETFKSEEEMDDQSRLLDFTRTPQEKDHLLDHAWKEEVCSDQQLWKQESDSSLGQKGPEPLQIKEEQQEPEHPWIKEESLELCIGEDEEQLVVKQETEDTVMVTPPLVEKCHIKPEPIRNQVSGTKTHTAEKRFKCLSCEKIVTKKYGLNEHVRTNTCEKPLLCTVCGRAEDFCPVGPGSGLISNIDDRPEPGSGFIGQLIISLAQTRCKMDADEVKRRLAAGGYVLVAPPTKAKSEVWNSFDHVCNANNEPVGYVKCKRCDSLLKYDSKTTGNSSLKRHVDRSCPRPASAPDQPTIKSNSIQSNQIVTASKPIPPKVKQAVTEKCVSFCCKDIRPFNIINGEGFEELAQELINVGAAYGRVPVNSVIPSHVTIANRCTDMAEEKRKALVQTLKALLKDGTVAMTTDMWTEEYRKISYLTVTCHFITEDMKLVNKTLTTTMFPSEEAKTGENVRQEILKLLVTKFGLDFSSLSKIVWVTDEGTNLKLALRPYQRLDCIDHVINTVLCHGLDIAELSKADSAPDIADTISAAKSLVRYVKQSGLAAQLSTTLLQMEDTRFSTVYLTLTSIQSLYHELHEKLEARGESAHIQKIAPDILGFLIDFLKPFYEAQREFGGDKYPTLNRVCLWYEKLKRHCQPNALESTQQAVVRKRHKDWLARKVIIQDLHKIATFLWPKFNQLRMLSDSDRQAVHAHVRTLLQAMGADLSNVESRVPELSGVESTPPAKRANFAEWENVQEADRDDDEVTRYIETAVMENEMDVLVWWNINKQSFPKLAKLARSVLCIPASTSSSERVFSAGGRTISERRTALNPSTVDSIIFLHKNM